MRTRRIISDIVFTSGVVLVIAAGWRISPTLGFALTGAVLCFLGFLMRETNA